MLGHLHITHTIGVNIFVHTEALRVTPIEVENRISYEVPGFQSKKKHWRHRNMSYGNAPAAEQTIWVLFGGVNKLIHTKNP